MADILAESQEIPQVSNVRLMLAGQLHNVYLERFGRPDPIAAILEEKAEQRIVVVRAGLERDSVIALGEGESKSFVEMLGSQDIRSQLLQSSLRRDDRHDWPEAVRALTKKIDHGKARKIKDPNFVSAFEEFTILRVNATNLPSIQETALKIIGEVLDNIGTVIDTVKRTEVIANSGRGIRFFKNPTEGGTQIVFAGFIDSLAYKR